MTDPAYEEVNNAFERSLVFMHKVRGREEEVGTYFHLLLILLDASDLAGLLPVPDGPAEGDENTPHL